LWQVGALFFGQAYNIVNRRDPDKGPARVLCVSIFCGLLGSVLYVAADSMHSPWTAFLGRALTGLWTGGKQSVEQAYMAERAPKEKLTEYTAELGTAAVVVSQPPGRPLQSWMDGHPPSPAAPDHLTCLCSAAPQGFTCGPLVGAVFTFMPRVKVGSWLTIDQFTGPGMFLIFVCVSSMWAVMRWLPGANPEYRAVPGKEGAEDDGVEQEGARVVVASTGHHRPDRFGIGLCMVLFFAHYFNFAIQETMTTPFVLAAYQVQAARPPLLPRRLPSVCAADFQSLG
jgi:MFS family permease